MNIACSSRTAPRWPTTSWSLRSARAGSRRFRKEGVQTFFAEDGRASLSGLLGDLKCGWSKSVAFVVPLLVSWTLPAYALALLTARDLDAMGIDDSRLTIVTPEEHPLGLYSAPRPAWSLSTCCVRQGLPSNAERA